MKIIKKMLILFFVVLLAACTATTQRTFDVEIPKIVAGKSTATDVRRLLGEPRHTISIGGVEKWTYIRSGNTTGNVWGDAWRKAVVENATLDTQFKESTTGSMLEISFKKGVVSSVAHGKSSGS